MKFQRTLISTLSSALIFTAAQGFACSTQIFSNTALLMACGNGILTWDFYRAWVLRWITRCS